MLSCKCEPMLSSSINTYPIPTLTNALLLLEILIGKRVLKREKEPATTTMASFSVGKDSTAVRWTNSAVERIQSFGVTDREKKAVELYGISSDPFTKMVFQYLKEKRRCHFVSVQNEKAFPALQFTGKFPVVRDGLHTLFGSRDIIMHCAKQDENEEVQREVKKWLETEEPKLNTLLFQHLLKCFNGPQGKAGFESSVEKLLKKFETSEKKLLEKFETSEKKLSGQKFLAGKTYSLAELIHRPTIHFIYENRSLFGKESTVGNWKNKISAIPEIKNS